MCYFLDIMLSTLQGLSHLIFRRIPIRQRYYYFPHFTDAEPEAQRSTQTAKGEDEI